MQTKDQQESVLMCLLLGRAIIFLLEAKMRCELLSLKILINRISNMTFLVVDLYLIFYQ